VVVGDVLAPPTIACAPNCTAADVLSLSGLTTLGSPFTITAHRRSA
jgi:hypothetical protein